MAKGFVRESISSCLVPARSVPKKNDTFRIHVDSRAINNITVKYRYRTLRLDDMLYELYRCSTFSKVN